MNDDKVLHRLFEYLRPYSLKLVLLIFLFISNGLVAFISPLLFKELLDKGLAINNLKLSLLLAITIFLLTIFSNIIEFLKELIRVNIKMDLSKKLYIQSINKILTCKIEYLKTSTETYNNIDYDIQNSSGIMDDAVFFAITQIFSIIGGAFGIFYISWKLACVVLLLLPLKYFIASIISKKREQLSVAKINGKSRFSVWCENIISSIKSIKLLSLYDRINAEFNTKEGKFIDLDKQLYKLTAFNELLDGILIAILMVIIYIVGTVLYFYNQITIGGILSFSTYFINISSPITAIMNIKFIVAGIVPSARRLFDFFDIEDESDGVEKIEQEKFYMIEVKNIDFSYDFSNIQSSQIKNVSFRVCSGEKIAILGKNGSGKSTLLNLILRFYKPKLGQILLNGKNVDEYNLKEYRNLFAVVDQNLYLFDDSIIGNIEVIKSIDSSPIFDKLFIDDLIRKHQDKNIGINGAKLSLGEKQKIAIARAINSNAEIYIFDEPTSSIDSISINNFWSIISNELNQKTIFCVTHSYDNLHIFDKILILEDGNAVYFGKYSEKEIKKFLN